MSMGTATSEDRARMWSRWRVQILTALFVVSLISIGMAWMRWDSWVSHCRREANLCGEKADHWEKGARNYRWLANGWVHLARENPEDAASYGLWAKRESYLAELSAKIAAVYRARERRWRWCVGAGGERSDRAGFSRARVVPEVPPLTSGPNQECKGSFIVDPDRRARNDGGTWRG